MNSSLLFFIITCTCGLASILYVIAFISKNKILNNFGRYFFYFSIFGITIGMLLRWIESYDMGIGHIPLSNLYESLIFFAWSIGVLHLYIERKYKNIFIAIFNVTIVFLVIAYASLSKNIDYNIRPLVPALQSNWLVIHVMSCFFGYAAFAISFCLSVMYLIKLKCEGYSIIEFFPRFYVLDELNYKVITFGFLFLTIGIITGAVWANCAWGSYWSWDPKETWSLITWFVYSILLHVRYTKKRNGKTMAYISIAGFIAVLFTYFGVNYLDGLHSYAKF